MYSSLFQQNFEIVKAVTPGLIDEAYQLRYQVYCEEKGYEDAERCPDRREYDEYDSRSMHCLIKHKGSGIYIGVARLILPQSSTDDRPLPVEKFCKLNLSETHPHLASLPKQSIGEVSRFSVSKVFRRRIAEQGLVWGIPKEDECYNSGIAANLNRRHLPLISMGLIAGVFDMCTEHNIEYCYAAMEPTLLRLLKGIGINFQPLSMPVEYHGWRVPSFFPVKEMKKVMQKRAELLDIVNESTAAYQGQGAAYKQLAVV